MELVVIGLGIALFGFLLAIPMTAMLLWVGDWIADIGMPAFSEFWNDIYIFLKCT